MIVGQFSFDALQAKMGKNGVSVKTGPFINKIHTRIPAVVRSVLQLYAAHPVCDDDYADFHVEIFAPGGVRRFYHQQANFSFDGFVPFKPLPLDQAFAMLEWGLNWCVTTYAHHYLIIHAAVLEKNGRAVIMPGMPGSGKSTLTAALSHRGWRLLSDELTLLDLNTGDIEPLARPVSLKNESIGIIQRFADQSVIGEVANDTAKGTVAHMMPPIGAVENMVHQARPAWVIFPKYQQGAKSSLVPCGKGETVIKLAENSFNYNVLGSKGFNALNNLVKQCDCFQYEYSQLDDAIETYAGLASS